MKLMVCAGCKDVVALGHEWQECSCLKAGGMYQSDGDTVLVTESATLIGVCNHLVAPFLFHKGHESECTNAWLYPENWKVTRIKDTDLRPTRYYREDREVKAHRDTVSA